MNEMSLFYVQTQDGNGRRNMSLFLSSDCDEIRSVFKSVIFYTRKQSRPVLYRFLQAAFNKLTHIKYLKKNQHQRTIYRFVV